MAVRKPAKNIATTASQADIDRVIQGGSPPRNETTLAPEATQTEAPKDVSFTLTLPAELAKKLDKARALTRTSRRAWLVMALQEKLEREGRM